MSELLPLFPLPSVVLFPNVFLPLHIFEPRYRAMTADALASDRLIGMVLLRPGWERDYEGRPPIYRVGCSGVITHVEQTQDGRYNLVLRGLDRFKIVEENDELPYRRAIVEPAPERRPVGADREAIHKFRAKLESILARNVRVAEGKIPKAMPDEDLVNALAQYLDLQPIERQALLECDGTLARCRALIELLEMKTLAPRGTAWNSSVH